MMRNCLRQLVPVYASLTFTTRAVLVFGISFVVFATITGVVTPIVSTAVMSSGEVTEGTEIAAALAKQSTLALIYKSAENATEAAANALRFPGIVHVALYDDANVLLLAQGLDPDDWRPNVNARAMTSVSLQYESTDTWHFISPVRTSAEQSPFSISSPTSDYLGYVHVVRSKTPMHRVLTTLFSYTVVLTAASLGVSLLLLLWLINLLVRPIRNLSKTLQEVGDGTAPLRAEESGPPEIRTMARHFNRLMEQIETDRRLLENKVSERTQELAAARDEAQAANRQKSEFLAITSHELRTPLQAIVSYTQMLIKNVERAQYQSLRSDLNVVLHRTNHLTLLINNLLDMSKIEAGRMEVNWELVDLASLLDEVVETVRPLASERENSLVTKFDGAITHCVSDKWKLLQIFLNLLSNACKFTHHGVIQVTITTSAQEIQLTVADTGPGIAKEEHGVIFDTYRRGRHHRNQPGSGLGLAIVRQFCSLMGGTIGLESELGRGALFCVRLPFQGEPIGTASLNNSPEI